MEKKRGKPQPFGTMVEGHKVNFALKVPAGKKCSLLLYREGSKRPYKKFDMPENEGIGEVRFLEISDIEAEKYEYNFLIDGEVYVDPYVKEIAGKFPFGKVRDISRHQIRGKLVSQDYDWDGDSRLHLPWNEVVAYSLHIRGFTKHSSSKVQHKGTYLGLIEKIPYLLELGINQIQCMPVYEFEERIGTKVNYWGYGPAYYFAPKESYAAGNSAVCELKDMVKACHKAGIEVVLEMPFDDGIPAHTVVECLRFYMLEYHVDGFVVNPFRVPWEMLQEDPFLKDIKLIRKDEEFQSIMRRFLKGDENMVNDVIRELRHLSSEDGKCNYITGQTGFTMWDLVSYDYKHNEENGENNADGPDYNYSWNCGVEGPSRKKIIMTMRKNQIRNAFMLLLLAQGTPCILAGDEFCNTQKGNNNVYCQDNEISWLNWNRKSIDEDLFNYVKALIRFRKIHPCLHRKEELLGLDKTACGVPDVSYHGENAWQVKSEVWSRELGIMYSGADLEDNECFIAYNMHWLPHVFALPSPGKKKKWSLAFDRNQEFSETAVPLEDQKSIKLKERSIIVLISIPDEKSKQKTKGKRRKKPVKDIIQETS